MRYACIVGATLAVALAGTAVFTFINLEVKYTDRTFLSESKQETGECFIHEHGTITLTGNHAA